MTSLQELESAIIHAIGEKKGRGIVVADMSRIEGAIAQRLIICEGTSPTQVEAIATEVVDYCRETLGEKAVHCVGLENAVWVAIDFTDVIVHVFVPDMRAFYDLEHLWDDAVLTTIPDID